MQRVVDVPNPTVRRTLLVMSELAVRAHEDLRVRELTELVVGGLVARDWSSEIGAVGNHVLARVRYLRDTLFMEHIKTVPALLFRDKQGDCDDIATAVAAMLLTIGVPVRLEAVGFNPVEGYSHVFTAAYDSSTLGWLAVDPVAAARTQTMLTKVKHRLVKVVR